MTESPASPPADPTAAGAAPGGDGLTVEDLKALLADAEVRVQQQRDQHLRAVAELDNVRKRAQRDVEQAHRFGLEKWAQELLPVKDSLDLAVENAGRADASALVEGQAATLRLLQKALERAGITEIDPIGQPFDADWHEAVAAQPSDTAEPNSVLLVVQRGYSLNGRLLRAARVVVARAPA
jgi:molecular chaperone GrpE